MLLIALGSCAAALLPIGLALFALVIGTGFLGLLAAAGDVPEDTTSLATMIGLGVGIDYALFVLTRYRQLVSDGHARVDAIAHANATAGQAVVFAGTTVLIAIVGLRASGLPAIAMMGYGTAIVVALSVLAAVTLLPALLGAVGHRIDGLTARTRRRRLRAPADRSSRPSPDDGRTTSEATPFGYAIASLVLLVTLALPLGAPFASGSPMPARSPPIGPHAAGVRPPHRCLRAWVQRNPPRGHRPHGDATIPTVRSRTCKTPSPPPTASAR